MMRLGFYERYAHFRQKPHPMLSSVTEGVAEILIAIGLLVVLALMTAVLFDMTAARWW